MLFDQIFKKVTLEKNLNDFDEYTCMITLLTKEAFSLFRICEFTIYNCQSLRETKTPTDPRLCNMTWLRWFIYQLCICAIVYSYLKGIFSLNKLKSVRLVK